MEIIRTNALWRAGTTLAKLLRKSTKSTGTDAPLPTVIDLHTAQDIGLHPSDVARHNHRWPSQTSVHPRL